MTMTWKDLLSETKLQTEQTDSDDEKYFSKFPINPFELDYNRIVTSAAFRRLQDKTQVFPLAKSDFVRTRLTHSIEVSTIAYQLGQMLTENVKEDRKTERARKELKQYPDIPSVLRCAGLIHDLGNPPFGHFGEEAIGSWFRENLDRVEYKKKPLREWLLPQMAADLEHFEGNAQALRLLCKARYAGDINVSYAVISSLVKYPTTSLRFDKSSADIKLHKPGIYAAEEETFRKVAENVGTVLEDGTYCRHPLTYLMEASDDIAYATADLEDAYKKKLFTLDGFTRYYARELDKRPEGDPQSKRAKDILDWLEAERDGDRSRDAAAFSRWLYYVRRWLMYVVVWKFFDKYDEIMAGTYGKELFADTYHEYTLKILKGAMKEFVYDGEDLVPTELSGHAILSFLLDGFVRAALYWDEEHYGEGGAYKPSQTDRKYLSLLPSAYKEDYQKSQTKKDEGYDLYLRLLMVTDHISSMTDAYARDLFRHLRGVE